MKDETCVVCVQCAVGTRYRCDELISHEQAKSFTWNSKIGGASGFHSFWEPRPCTLPRLSKTAINGSIRIDTTSSVGVRLSISTPGYQATLCKGITTGFGLSGLSLCDTDFLECFGGLIFSVGFDRSPIGPLLSTYAGWYRLRCHHLLGLRLPKKAGLPF